MQKSFTNSQICLILYCTVVGYGVINIPKTSAENAGTGGWFSILISGIIFIFVVYVITYLQYVYENETIYEYGIRLLGKPIAYTVLIIYIIYYVLFFSMIIRIYSDTINLIILNKTPVKYISLLISLVLFYALLKGGYSIANLCIIYGSLNLFSFILINCFLATQGELINTRPLFVLDDIGTYLKAVKEMLLPFTGPEALLFITFSRENNKNIIKHCMWIMALISILYIFIVEVSLSIVGVDSIVNYRYTLFSIVKGIDIRYLETFRRLDGVYIIFWTMNFFCAMCVWAYGSTVLIKKLVKKHSYNFYASIVVIISYVLSQIPNDMNQVETLIDYTSYLSIFTCIILPIILFIITKVKKYDKNII